MRIEEQSMSFRLIDGEGNLIGTLLLSGKVRIADLEWFRRLGTWRIELVSCRSRPTKGRD